MKPKLIKHCKYYCKNTNIEIAFSLFKGPWYLRSFIFYRFKYSGSNATCVSEITRHSTTGMKEHLKTDPKSYIFKYLNTKLL